MSNFENDTRYRAASLGALLARHYPEATPHAIGRVVFDMQSATRAAKGWGVRRCNEPMTEAQDARGTKRQDKAQARLNTALASANLFSDDQPHSAPATVSLGGDPRGACGHLSIPGDRGDGWGEGYAIY